MKISGRLGNDQNFEMRRDSPKAVPEHLQMRATADQIYAFMHVTEEVITSETSYL